MQVLYIEAVQVLVQPPQLHLRLGPATCPRPAAAAAAAARLELPHDVGRWQRLGASQQQRERSLPAVRGEEAHVVPQEAVQVVPLDEVEDVRMLRRELQEELEGRLLTWGCSLSTWGCSLST